ncbi:MAG: acetate kinase [Elusimicrobiaceae bacterium]|jgi:acetate kinase|nr:acetate kinase [Elusimicrobiaceae bacterium]MBT3954548.1 acetate kinase [Elusimicrobiaceae bacterium]MBT4007748.1 acetate kinase [Elusimicrobiaceae bacterium]MBT4403164.1 acetate kinase [Elusimicrobiaceae bacterium]MBT4439327.1 acetate kinase [Elusimicrobiaceae bacterium]
MIILCLNCGSSSVKYTIFDWEQKRDLAAGMVERVGTEDSIIIQKAGGKEDFELKRPCHNHREAIKLIMDTLTDKENGVIESSEVITSVGHRIVHGGEKFNKSVVITPQILQEFKDLADMAPLHNPANVMGVEAAQEIMPDIKHMAIMDTAWHQTMPETSFMYALPYEWYTKYGIRKYGFHGTSFLYNAKRAAVLLGKDPFKCNLAICHIGNGASINAVKDGVSFDTSMGLTPQEGLIMGTRAGDFDASIMFHMMKKENLDPDGIYDAINKHSGVLGITGKYTDRRDIEIAAGKGDARCQLSIDMESYRLKKYVGSYAAAVDGLDAIVFTAGVGERGPIMREKVLRGLEYMGVKYDHERNYAAMTKNAESEISAPGSKVKAFVIPTDEEIVFVEDVVALEEGTYDIHTNFKYRFQDKNYRNKLRDEAFIKEVKRKPQLLKAVINLPKGV